MSRVDRRYVDRAGATRERILDAAERLFAEHGVRAVSNRSVAEAAGQGNNTVVGYHFGTKADFVRALIRRHTAEMDARREAMVAALGSAPDVRRWVDCLVGPVAEHLAERGGDLVCPIRGADHDRSWAPRNHSEGIARVPVADHRSRRS
jgi:AcrR family transcriptional regulator